MVHPKKILVITPRFPYPEAGADEQDRAGGIRQLVRLGYQVRVIAKYFDWQNPEQIKIAWAKEGVLVELVPYRFQNKNAHRFERLKLFLRSGDGSTVEFAETQMVSSVNTELREHRPDLVWFDYTYLTPLYALVKKSRLPIVVRSINFEPVHYWEENKQSWWRAFKYPPKLKTEIITANRADVLFAITPLEARRYRCLAPGNTKIYTLPLRSLSAKLGTHTSRVTETLHAWFAGSTFSVSHNLRALEFVVGELAPVLWDKFGARLRIHIFGGKVPVGFLNKSISNVVYEGFVPDLDAAVQEMDIALAPSFFGAGMQQKVFEPLARGFPTITHRRALAGYPFVPDQEVILAENVLEYVGAIEKLFDFSFRAQLGAAAARKARVLFNQTELDRVVSRALAELGDSNSH